MVDAPEGSQARAAAKIAALTRLKAIGPNDATILTHEVFYRGFRNRRGLASWVGVTPTPWASGDTQRDQGISRDGPAWIRAQLIQMAWRWLRYQPDSALSKWFNERTAGSRGRIRRVMIVALARKLLRLFAARCSQRETATKSVVAMGCGTGFECRKGWAS